MSAGVDVCGVGGQRADPGEQGVVGLQVAPLGAEELAVAGAALVVALVRRKSAQAIPRNNEPQEW